MTFNRSSISIIMHTADLSRVSRFVYTRFPLNRLSFRMSFLCSRFRSTDNFLLELSRSQWDSITREAGYMARKEKPLNESPTERWLVCSKVSHDGNSLQLEGTNMSQSYKSLVFLAPSKLCLKRALPRLSIIIPKTFI